jgi:DNA-binding response OmpR family regulator
MTKILAVEDEPDVATVLRLVFERAGYEFVCGADGPTGLRTLHEQRPDLVLLDVGLPGMDGWTVLARIRDLADVPVLMLTGYATERDKVRGLRGGAHRGTAAPRRQDPGGPRRPVRRRPGPHRPPHPAGGRGR